MHPEAFFPHRQNPLQVRIEDLSVGPLEGWRQVWDDTLGEYGLMTLLSRYLPEAEARGSVKGWRGDRVQVYEEKDNHRLLAVGYVVFDGESTADDFFKTYREFLATKYEIDQFRRTDDTIDWATVKDADIEVYVERFGRRVVFIEGTPAGFTSRVRGTLWDVIQKRS
jgi:hypothetical protein